ncbi:MAG: RNA 2',3'-cyclic phosphodiesterase [Elusimicrobia bacterium]|nr:RNA 2',3'-cyclic phosphodiesterase [Elusimicrobiota bacterium]
MRLFVSVPVPLGASKTLFDGLSALRQEFPSARWVQPKQFHFTLKFLDETDEGRLAELVSVLGPVALGHKIFSIALAWFGTFRSEKGAVFWADVGSGRGELTDLAASVENALGPWKTENQPFVPHLTLARFDGSLPEIPAPSKGGPKTTFLINRMALMQSVLKSGGAEHRILREFPLAAPGGVALGVDWGRRRVGVAVSDELGRMAHPLATLEPKSLAGLVGELAELARVRGALTLVLGLPKHMNGSEGESAGAVRQLAGQLEEAGLSVVLWDERLTSWEAQGRLREGGGGRGDKGRVDRAAAALLLQAYLDRERGGVS